MKAVKNISPQNMASMSNTLPIILGLSGIVRGNIERRNENILAEKVRYEAAL